MCEWTTHTVGGGLLWLAGVGVAHAVGVDLGPAAVAPAIALVGTGVAMGAAQLNDSDHHNSAIVHALGPVTSIPCRAVSSIFPHRGPTHYLAAVPVWAILAAAVARLRLDLLEAPTRFVEGMLGWVAAQAGVPSVVAGLLLDLGDLAGRVHEVTVAHADWQLGLFLVVAFLSAWGLRALSTDLDHSLGGTGEVVVGCGIAAAAFVWVPLGWWVPVAVAAGVLSHDLTDLLTKGPIRFLWPLPWEFSLGLFVTGHRTERTVAAPVLLGVSTVLLWVEAVQPLGVQAHMYLVAQGLPWF